MCLPLASNNVRQALTAMVPQSVINGISCFVFYDDHPRDQRILDVTVCSYEGEVKEFYQREQVDSIQIGNISNITEISILRNCKGELFYLLSAGNELIILSKKDKLRLHERVDNVETFNFKDSNLKIMRSDDALPLVFDDNFNKLEDCEDLPSNKSDDTPPVVNELKRKLNEVRYVTKQNENMLEDYVNLRQVAAFEMYKNTSTPNPIFKLDQNEICKALQVRAEAPIVRFCNRKIVVMSDILNMNDVALGDICVLLHGTARPTIEYTTKLFRQIPKSPYWEEKKSTLDSKEECTIAVVVAIDELTYNLASRIDFEVVVSFTLRGKRHLLPLNSVQISAKDTMGENFDILATDEKDGNNLLLSILATSERTDLRLRHIKNPIDVNNLIPMDIFYVYLKMEKLLYMDNVAIYKKSPHHMLYGVIVILEDNVFESDHITDIQVYVRSPSQVMSLLYYIYDSVPYKIIATTKEYKLTAKIDQLAKYNEEVESTINFTECALSIQNQIKLIEDYVNDCLIKKMSETDNQTVEKVDILAQGLPKYLEFRAHLLQEGLKGITTLSPKIKTSFSCFSFDSDVIIIDE